MQQELPKTDTQGEECAWKWEFACVAECTRDMLSDLEQALTSTHDDGTQQDSFMNVLGSVRKHNLRNEGWPVGTNNKALVLREENDIVGVLLWHPLPKRCRARSVAEVDLIYCKYRRRGHGASQFQSQSQSRSKSQFQSQSQSQSQSPSPSQSQSQSPSPSQSQSPSEVASS